jgi:regulator of sigma E protease
LMPLIGSQETITLKMKSLEDGRQSQLSLPLSDWILNEKKPDPLESLGIEPFIPKIPPIVGEVVPNSPAAKAGLMLADKIISVDGKPVDNWFFLVDYVKDHPSTELTLTIDRAGVIQPIKVFSGSQNKQGKNEGFLGLRSQKPNWPAQWLRLEREGPITALGTALKQTWNLTNTTVTLMFRLVTGNLGIKSISGPIGIAQGAGDSGRSGLAHYLFFLALVSISLGVLNLLPIPMLDGGHLLYYVVELIQRKPVSEEVKSMGVYLGMVVLAALMGVALMNDISRLLS